EIATPTTPIVLDPSTSTPTQVNSLTSGQRFTIEAGKDAYLDVQHLTPPAGWTQPPFIGWSSIERIFVGYRKKQ
ncbi:MAG: hypothetical protein HGB05_03740, partial [Chloroflexi bacterium]|nr:hypothetical protein [Chloroflexota bacterium]